MLIAVLMLTSAIAVQATAPEDRDTINVIGRKPEEIRREAQAFVKLTGVTARPVARWVDPICPGALDVAPQVARKIEARVREIARSVGARVAPANCAANLKIVFAQSARSVIQDVAAKSPDSFADLQSESRALMFGENAPVRWWHTVQDRTKDGMRSSSPMGDPTPGMRLDAAGGTLSLGGSVHQQYRSSFLSSQMVRGIIAAKVIVDVKLAEGIPVDSIAAYAAMVGLSEIKLDEEAPPNSILGLFAEDGPRDLTPLDQNFLRALYKLPLDRTAIAHRGLLVRGVIAGQVRTEDK